MKCLVFALIVMVALNGIAAAPSYENSKAVCSPWLGYCQLTDQCCRDLICLTYAAKCVPGKIIDDKRPIGDGPFPPTGK
ncbi:uncharacterized protein LOC105208058 [Solenopsis invicta]|uniref:uncharacterized protein LOC105208058 n=1 Tax=Solenopsis invicta TaxID=13686 RepID=UPI00193E6D35|nr:uncharacterized protein LOC105208058 [Solenopsis invicta]XP_025994902.2 uncharacterized protein LOC105208058 [Solenopsis invicta]